MNIQSFLSFVHSVEELIDYIQAEILEELKEVYTDKIPQREKFLSMALDKLYSKTGEGFVFIIDEWDCILREKQYTTEDHKKYLDFIRNLLKDKAYVSLAYMTGILPIKKYGTHSALNMFDEYSMTDAGIYAQYIGFTEDEVKELCEEYHVDFEKDWYDGLKDSIIRMLAGEGVKIDYRTFQNDMTTFENKEYIKDSICRDRAAKAAPGVCAATVYTC